MLTPLVGRREIDSAQRELSRAFCRLSTQYPNAKITFRPRSVNADVFWHPGLSVWGSLNPHPIKAPEKGRYWNLFGVDDPEKGAGLNITCEVNPAHESLSRKVAGAYARDDDGRIYLLHSGRIGGGKKGIGPELFWRHWRKVGGETELVWDGQQSREYAVVAEIGAPSVPAQVASFVRHVADMKEGPAAVRPRGSRAEQVTDTFTNEPEHRSVYIRRGRVESKADHAPVAKALHEALTERALRNGNSVRRDAYVVSELQELILLFEIKTTSETQAVYTAVGQLMMNGRAAASSCQLVLILPAGDPRRDFLKQLGELGIELCTYSWVGDRVRFRDLDKVLRRLPASARMAD